MQQNKITILCTGAIDEMWIKEASSKNISIEVVPFIKTESFFSADLQQEIELVSMRRAAVVFTSANAVEAVAAELKGPQPDWKIFCIGHATRNSVEKYFGNDLIGGVAENANELARVIIDYGIAEDIIFFCGDQRRNDLPDALRENNIEVHEVIVYQTIATPHVIEKKYDGILFFSPSAVGSFFQDNQLNKQTILFAIGDTTAEEIKKFSTNKIVIADESGKKNLLEKALSYFQRNPIHH